MLVPNGAHVFLVTSLFLVCTSGESSSNGTSAGLRVLRGLFEQCSTRTELIKCLKIQALKIVDRALHKRSLELFEGVNLTVTAPRKGKALENGLNLNETKLEKLKSHEIDGLLVDTASRFLQDRKLDVNVSKLVEEGRRRRRRRGYGALYWALAIKGAFLAMAYNGIAVMSGVALILGKLALFLSAILGLKKLASSGQEKTTFEIIKQPKHSETHSHSVSYEDDGHYHRSYDTVDPSSVHKQVYRAYIPSDK